MSHQCEECEQEFGTLTRLRLHDCSTSSPTMSSNNTPQHVDRDDTARRGRTGMRSASVEVDRLEESFDEIGSGSFDAINETIATYERELTAASETGTTERYQGIRRTYEKRLITVLDDATMENGWPLLINVLDAYRPLPGEDFSHVTTVLQNVTGRQLIRTRLAAGIEAVPTASLEYLEAVRNKVEPTDDIILEDLHPYGWGIGHSAVDVGENLHAHASKEIFSTGAMLEHAFYADQHNAVGVLERIIHDDSIRETIQHRLNETISEARYLLDAPAGAASDQFWPSIPRYWDWQDELGFEFELDAAVERSIRDLVRDADVEGDLPRDWEITDLML